MRWVFLPLLKWQIKAEVISVSLIIIKYVSSTYLSNPATSQAYSGEHCIDVRFIPRSKVFPPSTLFPKKSNELFLSKYLFYFYRAGKESEGGRVESVVLASRNF